MIRIGKFGITADTTGYTVGRIAQRKNKNTGEETDVLVNAKYYSGLPGCLRYIRKQMHLEAIAEYDGDLSGAIDRLNDTDRVFDSLVRDMEEE